ncbi:MAG: methionine adenosyltransferase [Chlamydiota bacterium]
MSHTLFTSESVTCGHPDKVADQISDAILDACLEQDPASRVACEVLVTTGLVILAGEITTKAIVDFQGVARNTIKKIGYDDPAIGFDYDCCAVVTALNKQSPDISQGVSEGQGLHKEQGAGDQGMMFGYACDETPELMPMPIMLANQLVAELIRLRVSKELPYLKPDGKTQVTIEYDAAGKPLRIHTVVISTQHTDDVTYETIAADLKKMIKDVAPKELLDDETIIYVNPTGRFVIGGPKGDCGLTGRKTIVDTYGGMGSHGGGAFSGKDPSKVDRSASYAARYAAKNVVAAGLAKRCEIQLAYAIGVANPVSVKVDTEYTGVFSDEILSRAVETVFDFTPSGIISELNLLRPIYSDTAYGGHFGRLSENFTWERTDKVEELKKAVIEIERQMGSEAVDQPVTL